MGLEPGEYFIVLEAAHSVNRTASIQYLPLMVYAEFPFLCAQRGLAARENDIGWIISDLQDLKDITLPFYNVGNHPIISLSQVVQYTIMPNPRETKADVQFYTISPNGNALIQDDSLTDFTSDYVDFDSNTLIFPEEVLKAHLAKGDSFHISVGYSTTHSRFCNAAMNVQVVK